MQGLCCNGSTDESRLSDDLRKMGRRVQGEGVDKKEKGIKRIQDKQNVGLDSDRYGGVIRFKVSK